MSDNTINLIFTSPSDELHEEMMKLKRELEMGLMVPSHILEGKYTKKEYKPIESRFELLDFGE